MERGIKGLSYLAKLNIINAGGQLASIEAYRAVLYKVQELQANHIQNITLTAEVLPDTQPYFNSTWTIVSTGATTARATVTFASAIAGDTVTMNGLTYTGVDGIKASFSEFSVDTSDNAAAIDLEDSINNDTRVGLLADLSAISFAGVVTVSQTITGADGNNTPISTSNITRIIIFSSTFGSGKDPDTYTLTFVSEDNQQVSPISPPGLTVKRPLDIAFTGATNEFTVRSIISVIDWIERYIEVRVSSTGADTSTDGAYPNAIFKGATPYITFTWTVVKVGDVYILTSTATS